MSTRPSLDDLGIGTLHPLAGGEPARATITARFDPRPKVGDRIPLGISPDAVHVFDPATGSAIR